jgi:glutamate/tyrosine decarboxylase-like PLP-dependent enzyme
MFVHYDCGMVLVRNEVDHRAAFAARPAYLESQTAGVGGGDPWFCDYGTDLSRGFRALKIWTTLRCHGWKALSAAVPRNCELAALMGHLVEQSPRLCLITSVRSTICCFTLVDADAAGSQNVRVVHELQMRGIAVFSTTKINGQAVIRAAITNQRTREEDVAIAVEAVAGASN